MRILRVAAVLILLGLSLGTSGASAAKARSEGRPRPARTVLGSTAQLWDLVRGFWIKEGCRIDPLGRCLPSPAPQTQNTDAGCVIDPWGRCSLGQ